jgi:hypothetical protein
MFEVYAGRPSSCRTTGRQFDHRSFDARPFRSPNEGHRSLLRRTQRRSREIDKPRTRAARGHSLVSGRNDAEFELTFAPHRARLERGFAACSARQFPAPTTGSTHAFKTGSPCELSTMKPRLSTGSNEKTTPALSHESAPSVRGPATSGSDHPDSCGSLEEFTGSDTTLQSFDRPVIKEAAWERWMVEGKERRANSRGSGRKALREQIPVGPLARDRRDGRRLRGDPSQRQGVALKLMHTRFGDSERQRKRFLPRLMSPTESTIWSRSVFDDASTKPARPIW